jgi:hypothetical protein
VNAPPRFALLQIDREATDPMVLAKAFAAIRGTPVHDQVLQAKRSFGIVADDLSHEDAKAMAVALKNEGVNVAMGPTAALAQLPAAEAATSLDAIPTQAPTLVSVAAITIVTTRTTTQKQGPSPGQKAASMAIKMSTGLPISIGGKKQAVQKTQTEETLAFVADLHYRDPARRMRINASAFDFSCLKERMLYQAQANLKLLLGDVVASAPDAWLNQGARVLLAGQPIRTLNYATVDDLEREARWLLTLRLRGL